MQQSGQESGDAPTKAEAGYRRMGDYLLLERIAVGGMGEVWLAKRRGVDGEYGELRALKFLHARHAKDPEVVAMFVEEARLASRLEHPAVARLYELGRDEDTYYIAMEHLFGRDLLSVLRRARDRSVTIAPPLVAMIGQRLADALDAARNALDDQGKPLPIVHRDISPQNIVLGFDGRVKLIDFGIARTESVAKERGGAAKPIAVHGKLGYFSPEQARGETVDHRSDQFSLGICLWELLVLRPLFRRKSDSATLDDVIRARVPPIRSKVTTCPVELTAVVEKMLQKDPDARFPEPAAVSSALSDYLNRVTPKVERQDLAAFLRKLFDEDYNRDRMRFDALELVGLDAKKRGDATPPRGVPTALAMASSSLFDEDPHEQATTIFPDAGPLAQRAEREVLFRRDSIPSRPSDPSGSRPRGPIHGTFRPGRAGAAEVWRPPASDLIEHVAAFEDPALAEERERASFEGLGAFTGLERGLDEEKTPVPDHPIEGGPPLDGDELDEIGKALDEDLALDIEVSAVVTPPPRISRSTPPPGVAPTTTVTGSFPAPRAAPRRKTRWGLALLFALAVALVALSLLAVFRPEIVASWGSSVTRVFRN